MYHLERKDCAAHLLNFPYKLKIPLEYCIVEVIFSELLHMPTPRYLEIAYGAMLIELCKLQPSTMPQVLAQATEMLFMRIDSMNVSCFDRFVNWFSYHLSNFQFRWSWEDWDSCLSLDDDHPKPKFIRETMLKSMRYVRNFYLTFNFVFVLTNVIFFIKGLLSKFSSVFFQTVLSSAD